MSAGCAVKAQRVSQAQRGAIGLRLLASLVCAVVLLLLGLLCAPMALATTEYQEVTGEDPYQTSVMLSQAAFSPGVEAVVIANGDDFRSAVCSSPLAAAYGGPVLLTPGGVLDPRVRKEVARLDPSVVFLVGVSPSVDMGAVTAFPRVSAEGNIVTLRGTDPYDTAKLVAEQVAAKAGRVWGVVLVPGDEVDRAAGYAVAVSALAASKGWPVLFTPAGGPLPASTSAAISGLGAVVALEVGTSVAAGVPGQAVQFVGDDSYETNARLAEYSAGLGQSFSHVAVVNGDSGHWAYGLALGAYLAKDDGVVLVAGTDTLPVALIGVLRARVAEIDRLDFYGPFGAARDLMQICLETKDLPLGFAVARLTRGSEGEDVAWLEQRLTDLSYRPGPVDGVFDKRTRNAVVAFEKWEGLKRDGIMKADMWWAVMLAERPAPKMQDGGTWIEVDKSRQILLYCVDGTVERTIPVSTGNASVGMITPSGTYHITRENSRERVRYKPLYLRPRGVLAIHGYTSVPVYPASHGCVRMTWADMDEFHDLIPLGTTVHIY